MIIESGTDADFKRSLIYGWGDTIRVTLERMNDRWMTVEYWAEADGLVTVDITTCLDRMHAMLHIGTYVLRHGLCFDICARVTCRHRDRSGLNPKEEHCEWWFDKSPARTGPSGESLPPDAAKALGVRAVRFSGNPAHGGDGRYRPVARGPAHASARRRNLLHGFRV